jgi:hypothetical protein
VPVRGCVVVFARGAASGHVAFVDGRHPTRNYLMCMGGNQADAVNVAAFDYERVLGYRWPSGEPLPDLLAQLPLIDDAGVSVSAEEA